MTKSKALVPAPSAKNPAPYTPQRYFPGRIRAESDGELAAVRALTRDFPGYNKLPHDAIVDAASTFRTEEAHEERARLREAGVPIDWRRDGDDAEGA